jgi:biotin carboxylase
MSRTVLLVGARRPAVEAAARLGLRPCVLAEPGVTRALTARAAGLAEVDFDAEPEAILAAARRALDDAPVAAVAVSERAVLPAAAVRAAFGLRGLSEAEARVCRAKDEMKAHFAAAGLPCRPIHRVRDADEAVALAETLGWPVVVKALAASGSRGTVTARDAAEVRVAVAGLLATRTAGGAGLERFIRGPEVSVETFVAGGRPVMTSVTEYVWPGRANLLPAPLPPDTAAALLRLNARAVAAIGAPDGMTHAEYYLTDPREEPDGPLIGEIAARPPGGHLMELLGRAYAFDAWETFLRLAVDGDATGLPRAATRVVGNLFLHPGEGTVAAVEGWDAVQALPGVVEARLAVAAGDRVEARVGTGQSVGHVTVEGADADEVRRTLHAIDARLSLTMQEGTT